jgi:hypothetical protein
MTYFKGILFTQSDNLSDITLPDYAMLIFPQCKLFSAPFQTIWALGWQGYFGIKDTDFDKITIFYVGSYRNELILDYIGSFEGWFESYYEDDDGWYCTPNAASILKCVPSKIKVGTIDDIKPQIKEYVWDLAEAEF